MDPLQIGLSVGGSVFGVLLLFFILRRLARQFYHRVPPNQVMVIYGRGRTIFDGEGAL